MKVRSVFLWGSHLRKWTRRLFGCVFKETNIKHAYFEKTQSGVDLTLYLSKKKKKLE
jgi:hypothetical protein